MAVPAVKYFLIKIFKYTDYTLNYSSIICIHSLLTNQTLAIACLRTVLRNSFGLCDVPWNAEWSAPLCVVQSVCIVSDQVCHRWMEIYIIYSVVLTVIKKGQEKKDLLNFTVFSCY